MNKLWLIIKREYLSRVTKKSFILTTLLTPLGILVFSLVVGLIFSYDTDQAQKIAVKDVGGILNEGLESNKNINYVYSNESLDSLKAKTLRNEYNGILLIPALDSINTKRVEILYYSDDKLSVESSVTIQNRVKAKIKDYKIVALGIDPEKLDNLNTRISLNPEPISDTVEDISSMSTMVGSILGGVMGYMMFFIILFYGMMVLKSVMEEKTNRIVEIIISSVKPFQLMLGKIIGIGGVGFTQIAIWFILIPLMLIPAQLIFGFDTGTIPTEGVDPEIIQQQMKDSAGFGITEIVNELMGQNWALIIPLFIFYFLGGYFIYTSLFAAVGSAIGDDINESNALLMPIMMPIILAVYIMFRVVALPQSNLAIWSSIFPLTSPIIMPARLSADVPLWQLVASVLSLVLSGIFFVWLSGRIYRVGILMYGKKASFKELAKWIFYKS